MRNRNLNKIETLSFDEPHMEVILMNDAQGGNDINATPVCRKLTLIYDDNHL